jgi:hypothetical protein
MSLREDQAELQRTLQESKALQIKEQEELQRNLERAQRNKPEEEKELLAAGAARKLEIINQEAVARENAAHERFRQLREQERQNVEWTRQQNAPGRDDR